MSDGFPWYDSQWLRRYVDAKQFIARHHSARLQDFVGALECLRTRPDFTPQFVDRVFSDEVLQQIAAVVNSLPERQLELHEAKTFRRFVVHDHPFFNDLQRTTEELVSELAGEPVESTYNFLSLYSALGVCPLHMDSPRSKWTLDICLDQSLEWPIYFSQIVPWPEEISGEEGDWEGQIERSPGLTFEPHVLRPGQAVLFSGSSQWHYRDALRSTDQRHFCSLLFFHYLPRGMKDIVDPKSWPAAFALPDLAEVVKPL